MFDVQALTLLVLGIYTSINYCLYKTATNNEEITERAYVNVQNVRAEHGFAVGSTADALVDYKNVGLTPAKDLWIYIGVFSSRTMPKELTTRTHPKCETIKNGEVLPPGITRHKSSNILERFGVAAPHIPGMLIQPDDYAAIISGAARWIVSVSISYRDQFGQCHYTREPFSYNPQTSEFDPMFIGWEQTDD